MTKKDEPATPPGCACADCGHEQSTMDPCAKCRSVRVVLISAIRDLFGEDWRSNFATEPPLLSKKALDQEAENYCPTRGKLDKPRHSADSVLRAVEKGGEIQLDTLAELVVLLRIKTDYLFHIAVEILPTGSALLTTIDNERDAKETIRRLKEKP